MKNNVFLLLTLFSFTAFAQVSKKTASIIKPLEKYTSFYALDEKIKGIEENLYKEASSDELVFLAEKGKNPYIKATAVNVLTKKSDKRLLNIFKNSFQSKEEITYRTECLSDSYPLSGIFFDTIPSAAGSEEEEEKRREEMAIMVLNAQPLNKQLLEYTSHALPVNPEIYKKLRSLVLKTKSPELLVTLAKYRNPDDIELIKSFGAEAYPAIEEFPDPKFLPFMKEHSSDSSEFPFMFALSNFCSAEAKELVIKAIELNKIRNKEIDCGNGCLSTIYQQIDMKKCKLNYPVLANLWLTDKIISFDVLDDYVNNHTQEETEKFLLNGFMQPGEAEIMASNMYDMDYEMNDVSDDMSFDSTLRLVRLLEKVKNISQKVYEEAVKSSIQNVDDLGVDDFILKLKDNTLILQNKDVLLDRLKNNESAYGILIIMNGVKMLDDKKLFDEGAAIVVSRKAEFGKFPVWEKEYKNFIRENNIKE